MQDALDETSNVSSVFFTLLPTSKCKDISIFFRPKSTSFTDFNSVGADLEVWPVGQTSTAFPVVLYKVPLQEVQVDPN